MATDHANLAADVVLTGTQRVAFDHASIIAAAVNHVRLNGW